MVSEKTEGFGPEHYICFSLICFVQCNCVILLSISLQYKIVFFYFVFVFCAEPRAKVEFRFNVFVDSDVTGTEETGAGQ